MKRKFYGMTIGIGMICGDVIVLGSDSKTEDDETSIKRFDLQKIEILSLPQEVQCAIVRSGMTSLSGQAVELIRARVNEEPPTSIRDLHEIVRKSVMAVRRDFCFANPNLHYADPTGAFSLIVATNGGKPRLVIARHNTASIDPEVRTAYIGTGRILADYILSGLEIDALDPTEAARAILYAVEIAKLKDSKCEGPAIIGFVTPGSTTMVNERLVEKAAEACRKYEIKNQTEWAKSMAKWVMGEEKLTAD